MSTTTTAGPPRRSPRSIGSKLKALFEFESVLAFVVAFIPVGLWIGVRSDYSFLEVIGIDGVPDTDENFRASISAHHDIMDARWFYAPLVIGAMMLLVSALARPTRHGYNAVLGIALFGLIWFDHDGSTDSIHKLSTAVFLGFAVLVVSAQLSAYLKQWFGIGKLAQQILLVVSIAAIAIVALWLDSALNTTAAEWFLLSLVSLHFFTHSWMHTKYTDVEEPMEILDTLVPGFKQIRQPVKDRWTALTT